MTTEGHAARPRPRIHAPLAARRWPPPPDWGPPPPDWEAEAAERRARERAAEPAAVAAATVTRPKWHGRQLVAAAPKPVG